MIDDPSCGHTTEISRDQGKYYKIVSCFRTHKQELTQADSLKQEKCTRILKHLPPSKNNRLESKKDKKLRPVLPREGSAHLFGKTRSKHRKLVRRHRVQQDQVLRQRIVTYSAVGCTQTSCISFNAKQGTRYGPCTEMHRNVNCEKKHRNFQPVMISCLRLVWIVIENRDLPVNYVYLHWLKIFHNPPWKMMRMKTKKR